MESWVFGSEQARLIDRLAKDAMDHPSHLRTNSASSSSLPNAHNCTQPPSPAACFLSIRGRQPRQGSAGAYAQAGERAAWRAWGWAGHRRVGSVDGIRSRRGRLAKKRAPFRAGPCFDPPFGRTIDSIGSRKPQMKQSTIDDRNRFTQRALIFTKGFLIVSVQPATTDNSRPIIAYVVRSRRGRDRGAFFYVLIY